MNQQLEFNGFEPTRPLRATIRDRIAHLEKRTRGFRGDSQFLRLAAEEIPVHRLFRISITLELPRKTLAAKEEDHDIEVVIRAAFGDIERQLEAYKSALRGESGGSACGAGSN